MTRNGLPDKQLSDGFGLNSPEEVRRESVAEALERRFGEGSRELENEMQECIKAMEQVQAVEQAKDVGLLLQQWKA